MKVVHIITGLGDGGAEHTLFKICKYDNVNNHVVISLKGPGKYYSLLKRLGIEVYCLNINIFFYKFFFLIKLLYTLRPDIVQTWLVHGDLIGGIAARLAGIKNILWNIRYSNFEIKKAKLTTILIVKILIKLSYVIPQSIVVVSKKAKKIYERSGYDKKKLILIPNGYDLLILKPSKLQKRFFKKKYKIKKSTLVIGNIARHDPKKDHLNLLNSLSIVRSKNINFICILAGSNIDRNNISLVTKIKELKLSNYVKLIGQKDNIIEIMNGLDIYIQSSSYGEGFPNVVAEAMACGVSCVVTDVGDAAFIVGKTGVVVPPNNSIQLANALEKTIRKIGTKDLKNKSYKSRLRIKENFDIIKMIKLYNKSWIDVYKKNKIN
jgi:glycosyltransferase involved in cell wall biosynthesis